MTPVNDGNYHTITLTTIYDENSENYFNGLKDLVKRKYPFVELIGFHENTLKGRKKAFQTKGSFGARQTPFAIMVDLDKNPIKAFYSEANECTVDKIEDALDSFIVCSKISTNESNNN
jgi:hypothetical protein